MNKRLLWILNRVSPKRCRLLARRRWGQAWRPASHSDIAKRSGLARSTVVKLSKMDDWHTHNVGVATMLAYADGCRVSLLRPGRRRLQFWKNAAPSQRRMIDRLT